MCFIAHIISPIFPYFMAWIPKFPNRSDTYTLYLYTCKYHKITALRSLYIIMCT